MSTAGFNSQNGTGTGQSYTNGPSQHPLYSSGPYQPVQPTNSYQPGPPPTSYLSPPGPPLLTRPAMGSPLSHTPPQSVSPGPGPRMPPAQPTPPPPAMSSSSYYPNPQQQQAPAWQYNTAPPPTGPPISKSTPPRGPLGNHVTPAASSSLPPPPPSTAYSAAPPAHMSHMSHSTMQPPGPRMPPTSAHGFIQPGSGPLPMNPMTSHAYQAGRAAYGPPPTGPPPAMKATPPPPSGPPISNATPLPPKADGTVAGNGPPAPNSFNHVDNKMAGTPQPGPPGRQLGHYPSLPPGYQNTSVSHGAMAPMHPAMQATTQPYSQAPQPYQQPGGPGPAQLSASLAAMSLQSSTPEALRVVNLLQERNLLPPTPIPAPTPCLPQDLQKVNCHPEVFRSTLCNIPQTQSLLNKAKMPLGLLLHPFKDLSLRPPQPAVYLFILDVSHNAVETGYLNVFCQSLLDNISSLPGDSRTKIGFITFDSTIHFYNLQEGLSQPQMLIVSDIEDIFLPTPDSLLVNLNECKELVQDLLKSLPTLFQKTMETQSALGSALQAGFKLLSPTGGRMTVFQTQLPNLGAGALQSREDPNQRASAKDIQHLSPATDFYKTLALDCSGQQVAVDLFMLSAQYCDLASLGCISRFSAGSVYHYPSYHHQHNPAQVECFQKDLKRYLTRKIGFEAVMRIRCSKGLSIHTFHGNFFVRSTDLLSLPNVNPDAGFAVQMSIDENLDDMQVVSFQAALLYTSSKGERRIRVHTLCLPVVNSLSDIFAGADVQAITGLLACMAVDRSVTSSLGDARDALTNAAIDSLTSYRQNVLTIQQPGLLSPACLRLFPLFVLALLKQKSFRTGTSTRLDDRVFSMCQLKYQPLAYSMLMIHPSLYRVDDLTD
ncbi:hypothetical protein fugu_009388 [Takifugu bimaculatus]|uniref:VWFA domain-containing protein n=1 Tax=Takifugu bimaculatus TaxID=433685 RepID=A0A4Z2B2V1_9TELE|nr:hypothetical protein fugu_009388 [Takifugu bimaculatus]